MIVLKTKTDDDNANNQINCKTITKLPAMLIIPVLIIEESDVIYSNKIKKEANYT